MGDITAAQWTRYGKDRLYLSCAGDKLGWYDRISGELHLAVGADRGHVTAFLAEQGYAVAAPATTQRIEEPPPSPAEKPEPTGATQAPSVAEQEPPRSAEPAWDDLAHNRPGAAARARAAEERSAQQERSRVGSWLARALDVKTDERAWRVGADGEETVGSKLDKLTDRGWYVLHSVPVGRGSSDIDHVLIGPGGVFTINTKRHPGANVWVGGDTVMVNGHRQPYVRNSRHEAQRASRLLSTAVGIGVEVTVRGVLVFDLGWLSPGITIKQSPEDVVTLDRSDIPRVFRRAKVRLGPNDITAIYDVARRSSTWHT